MEKISTNLKRLISDEEAASIVEYVVVIGTGLVVGAAVSNILDGQFGAAAQNQSGTAANGMITAINAAI